MKTFERMMLGVGAKRKQEMKRRSNARKLKKMQEECANLREELNDYEREFKEKIATLEQEAALVSALKECRMLLSNYVVQETATTNQLCWEIIQKETCRSVEAAGSVDPLLDMTNCHGDALTPNQQY